MYRDRQDAGKRLSQHLSQFKLERPLVLAIPRGGVVVGAEVAREIGGDLDIVMAKKIGARFNPEFAIGAVDLDGHVTLPPRGTQHMLLTGYINEQAAKLKDEIAEQMKFLRDNKPGKQITGRDVVLVDDGLATGLTALAAVKYIRRHEPGLLILAVPVSPKETLGFLEEYVDHVVCPLTPPMFYAVGQWYVEFDQVADDVVKKSLCSSEPS